MSAVNPFNGERGNWRDAAPWAASWIAVDGADARPLVAAYRLAFALEAPVELPLLVTADERFELFLDGRLIARGPERGEPRAWPVHAIQVDVAAGAHVLVARVFSLAYLAPVAQLSARHGFLLAAPGPLHDCLSTGVAPWHGRALSGWSFAMDWLTWGVGAMATIDGAQRDWLVEEGGGEGWMALKPSEPGRSAITPLGWEPGGNHVLVPARLPAMRRDPAPPGVVRHLEALEVGLFGSQAMPSDPASDRAAERATWQAWLSGTPLRLAAGTCWRAIIDLHTYRCAWPTVMFSGGAGATVHLRWAEGLYLDAKGPVKGHRDVIANKHFRGAGDTFHLDGGRRRPFTPHWWRAGRYVEIQVCIAGEDLVLESLALEETGYPLTVDSTFSSSDPRLEQAAGPMLHTLRMCMHETYVDCPYYEQLMYVGDTRLEVLATYAVSRDDRLPRAALDLFDRSRRHGEGVLTCSRFPSRDAQSIPPFSLWWTAMVYDFAMWRDDPALVRRLLPGARAVLDAFEGHLDDTGVLRSPPGWNFTDWTHEWRSWEPFHAPSVGVPPAGDRQNRSGILNWQLVYCLCRLAVVEDSLGESERAARARRIAKQVAAAADALFWDDHRGLWADDPEHTSFSEHAQALALLSDLAPTDHAARAGRGLLEDPNLVRTTIYFSHYLFEACQRLGAIDHLLTRMDLWFGLAAQGFSTTPEEPEPARSDCHAWGAHPLYHYRSSILGIRPAAPGFRRVRIEPQLGPLQWASGSICHPRGLISAEFRRDGNGLHWRIELPDGISGELIRDGRSIALHPGQNESPLRRG